MQENNNTGTKTIFTFELWTILYRIEGKGLKNQCKDLHKKNIKQLKTCKSLLTKGRREHIVLLALEEREC